MAKLGILRQIVLSGIVFLIAIAYPFLVYFGLVKFSATETALFVLMLVIIRLLALGRSGVEKWREYLPILAITASVAIFSAIYNSESVLRFNPAVINFGMLVFFLSTYFTERPFVERIARSRRGEPFPQAAVRYCWWVNGVWCLFFIASAIILSWSALYSTREAWVLLSGFGYWIAIGALIGVEFSFRKIVMEPKFKRAEQVMLAAQHDIEGARGYAA